MLTEKDYCDYETCVALKELGYKGISRFFYATKESPLRRYSYDQILTTRIADAVGHTLAISLYVAQKFLREENGIIVYPQYLTNGQTWMCLVYEEKKMLMRSIGRGSYNEVLNAGIKEAVKILKDE